MLFLYTKIKLLKSRNIYTEEFLIWYNVCSTKYYELREK